MQQTFPAGTAQRIVIFDVDGDLIVRGWDQQTIQVTSDESIELMQPEGDTLTIRGCSDTLELLVPVETTIGVKSVDGEVAIEDVRQVEVDAIGGDVTIKNISGTVELAEVDGDASLTSIGDDLTLHDIAGDLLVRQAALVRVGGKISGDAAFLAVSNLEIERVDGDLKLEETQETSVGRVGGDLNAKNGIAVLRCGSIGNDCHLQSDGNADVSLENIGNDLVVSGVARLQASNVGNDCVVQGSAAAELTLGNVGSDLRVIGAARVQVSNIGSDCELRDIQDDVSVGHVGSDAHVTGVGGNLRVGNIGSDAQLKGIGGSVNAGNIGSDLHLQAAFPAGSETRVTVGSDARIVLPDDANLTIRAHVGGDVSGRSIVSNFAGNFVNLVYGEGSALLELNVGGDLNLRGNAIPRSSSSVGGAGSWSKSGNPGRDWANFGGDWGDFGREMADFGREMDRFGRNLGRDISEAVHEATSSIGSDVASSVSAAKEQARRAQREAEEHRRRAEQEVRRAEREGKRTGEHAGRRERDPYFNVRINDREWKMGPERIDAIVEQARQAAAEGVQGALQAVEQALKNLHVPSTPPRPAQPGTPPVPPRPAQPGTPPAAPTPPATPTQENAVQNEPTAQPTSEAAPEPPANPEQEREAILRMIAEGRISPEEGDLLLEALGS
jgi:hypothetical protein